MALTPPPSDPNVFVAVGLLSAAASTAKSNSSIGLWRRSQLRASFAAYGGHGAGLRFLLAPSSLIPASDPSAIAVAPELLHEAATHRDMIFLNMTEGLYRCTRKYLEWLRIGPTLFPAAKFFVLGDDDIYLRRRMGCKNPARPGLGRRPVSLAWRFQGFGPLLPTPARRLGSVEARRGLRSPPRPAPKTRLSPPLSTTSAAGALDTSKRT